MPDSSIRALAHSIGALVAGDDVTHLVAALLDDAAEVLQAQAIGVVMRAESGELDVLAATSHRAGELELYQAQHRSGPCIEAIQGGAKVVATDAEEIDRRWPEIAPLIRSAGFTAVHAIPLRWHDNVLGALNIFHADSTTIRSDVDALGQAYADLTTALLLRPAQLTRDALFARVGSALEARTLIEQAKGVVAYTEQVDMDVAYDVLRQRAAAEQLSLVVVAQRVVDDGARRP
jgi:transcriptional regulator with GAF, ATPase, and Fis domain